MATEGVDYAAILKDAEAKKAALEGYINSLKAALAAGALGQPGELVTNSVSAGATGAPIELPVGVLSNKSVPAAILLYLSAIKKKQTSEQIATALIEGGVESRASNFEKVVLGTLWRLKEAKKMLKLKDGSWGLPELYPEHIRKAMFAEQKTASKKTTKKAQKVVKVKGSKSGTTKQNPVVVPMTPKLEQRIEAVLKSEGRPLSPSAIAQALQTDVRPVTMMLGRMAVKQAVEKVSAGLYRMASSIKEAV